MQVRSWGETFRNAVEGLVYGLKTQRNLRVHTLAAVLAVFSGFFFGISRTEWLFLLLAIALVMISELLNTAIEAVVDLASPQIHPLAKAAKDTAAGAVLLAAVFAVITGVLIFYAPIIRSLRNLCIMWL
ncbi:diacylglycerol kinase family protein [Paenibacillus sp. JX-17]|uniref:Diacylglycerol kinase family protein n=1 Tax=Paenibacillus lacisoli TaxID=3064525 RepID=A0ABT9CA79_9BACL|nr:diacylglycerol kinase family protein [Paenibacillus sp. JX-17]MDO7905453.1 diacylglycerol kinase family protein [Paenibacillus sp. JX-17]